MYREQIDMLVKQVRNFRFWQEESMTFLSFWFWLGPALMKWTDRVDSGFACPLKTAPW
jgi:hypothetical protein